MYVHAYTLYSAVRPFGCRWVQSVLAPERAAFRDRPHRLKTEMRGDPGRDDD